MLVTLRVRFTVNHSKHKSGLERYKIKHVLNVTQEWRQIRGGDIMHHRVPLADFTNEVSYPRSPCIESTQEILPSLPKAFSIISEARAKGEAILIHCVSGKSRSASIVIGR